MCLLAYSQSWACEGIENNNDNISCVDCFQMLQNGQNRFCFSGFCRLRKLLELLIQQLFSGCWKLKTMRKSAS